MRNPLYVWNTPDSLSKSNLPPIPGSPTVIGYLAKAGTAKWNSVPIEFIIDTGAATSVIPEDLVEKLGVGSAISGDYQSVVADGGVVSFVSMPIDLAVVFGQDQSQIGFMNFTISVFPSGSGSCLLGVDFLRFFTVIIDEGRLVALTPNPEALKSLSPFGHNFWTNEN
jgi:hypothetical protein